MSKYVLGIVLSFTAPVLHAGANILDAYFANRIFKRLSPLIFFGALVNLLFLPLVWFIDAPAPLSTGLFWIVGVISVIEVSYQYPYLWALRRLDTSVVTSLFSLGKFFTPLLALALVGERLTIVQYFGFFIIISCSVSLTFDIRKLRLDESLWLMLVASGALSLQTVLFKYVFEHGGKWGSVMTWTMIGELAIAGTFLLISGDGNYFDVKESISKIRATSPLMFVSQVLTWGGAAGGIYALRLIPVSVANGIDGTQPIFVLFLGLLLWRGTTNRLTKERLGKSRLLIKTLLFLLIAIGTFFVAVQ